MDMFMVCLVGKLDVDMARDIYIPGNDIEVDSLSIHVTFVCGTKGDKRPSSNYIA